MHTLVMAASEKTITIPWLSRRHDIPVLLTLFDRRSRSSKIFAEAISAFLPDEKDR